MSSLIKRCITGVLYIAVIVGSLLFTDWAFPVVCTLFGLLGLIEYYRLSRGIGTPSESAGELDILFGILILGVAIFGKAVLIPLVNVCALILLCILIRLTVQLYRHSENPIIDAAKSTLSLCWIVLPLVALETLFDYDRYITLLLFIMIWINDTGAFCAGSLLGRHKLFERISPKKTWEGWFGGFLLTALFGWFAPAIPFLHISLTPWQSMVMGIIVSVSATYGDLAESLFKRTLHAKDSGNILPGHGGILDRIDSLLFASPAVLLFMLYFI